MRRRVHCIKPQRMWRPVLLCGRAAVGQNVVPLATAADRADLCDKCRRQLAAALAYRPLTRRPAGRQLEFRWEPEYPSWQN